MDRLYVIVRSDLPTGLQMAQACHAALTYCEDHPERPENMIVLHAPSEHDLAQMAALLNSTGANVSTFREPDLDGQLTAIAACGTSAKRALAALPLAA